MLNAVLEQIKSYFFAHVFQLFALCTLVYFTFFREANKKS